MDNIKEIISNSSFKIEDGVYVYAKVNSVPKNKHFLISQDDDEITVVTTSEKLPELDLLERNKDDYKLIALNVSIPFYSVGFLATVSNAIAKVKMNVLIISTYSKDYIMVKHDRINDAKQVLLELGFKEL